MHRNPSAGFSLVELMVAMVITLIIVGAVVGLLTSGQSAFSTQPERTDRQQNLRVAMDMIMRDVASAGVGMPGFMQVFTQGLNNLGPQVGVDGVALTDEIEIITNTSGFPNERVCTVPGEGAKSTQIKLMAGKSFIPDDTPVVVIFWDGTWTIRHVTDHNNNAGNSGEPSCKSGDHWQLNTNPGKADTSGHNTPGGVCQPSGLGVGNAGDLPKVIPPDPKCQMEDPCCTVKEVGFATVVRYRINVTGGMPNLEKRTNGGAWEVLARGVEDLQVQYVRSDANWPATTGTVADEPVAVVVNDYTSLTTQVRVTLSARTTLQRIQGASTVGGDATTTALRGSLVSQASPRQALWTLTEEPSPAPVLRWN